MAQLLRCDVVGCNETAEENEKVDPPEGWRRVSYREYERDQGAARPGARIIRDVCPRQGRTGEFRPRAEKGGRISGSELVELVNRCG
jgi:hypothetical protein